MAQIIQIQTKINYFYIWDFRNLGFIFVFQKKKNWQTILINFENYFVKSYIQGMTYIENLILRTIFYEDISNLRYFKIYECLLRKYHIFVLWV